ncbi:MAG: hypothetical protein Q7T21_03070 [Gallionella sp.]|nr:hypothetical protein [Gallionella sp.]
MTMLDALKKKVVGMIPGTPLNIAQQKRAMEKELRKQGYSGTHARGLVSEHFSNQMK